MTPLHFGSSRRRLFGVLDPARTRPGTPRAALVCYPLGSEYIFAHRTLRHLARQLAARDFDVLRFDYYGSGDSAGDDSEVRLAGWREDIALAIEELRDSCQAKTVTLIGLRLGASLAAQVAVARQTDVSALVLWDAAVSGSEHLERLEIEWNEMTKNHCSFAGGEEERRRGRRYGLPISDELAFEIGSIDLVDIADKMPQRTLCLSTDPLPTHASWRKALGAHPKAPIKLESLYDHHPWKEADGENAATLPTAAIGRIVEWLTP